MTDFVHLHNHTHFSLLDAACTIDSLIDAAIEHGHKALALTDHGVMFGIYEFYKKATAKGIKPLIGFEAYVANGSRFERIAGKSKTKKRNYFHLVLLAKDHDGYKNLIKLSTYGFLDGFYYKPRIDKDLLKKHSKGVIALSACMAGVVNAHIVNRDYETAEKEAAFYQEIFKDDFYMELQNHGLPEDRRIIREAPKIAKKLGIKLVASNDVHYISKEHATAHNVMLLIKDVSANSAKEVNINELRYRVPEMYYKSTEEMVALFKDYPESITNTVEVADKCNVEFEKKLFMPQFGIPKESKSATLEEYLEELTYEGLHKIFGEKLNDEIKQRAEYELQVINNMGFPGYFLIVADFCQASRRLGVTVGPGRGSAAGSLVAYALGITNVDPLKYDLLFERFLNPERVSMPDIDIDFADNKRERVIDYVKEKYGEDSVAQIVTFGKLSSRMILKDIGRVLGIHHTVINEITSKIPVVQGKVTPLAQAIELPDLKDLKNTSDEKMKMLMEYSMLLEGLYRHTGIHAAGVVIAPGPVSDYVPLYKPPGKKEDLAGLATQYSMNDLEDAGLLKMDFLGLRTLTIIDNTLEMIEKNHNKKIDIDKISFNDKKTYDLFAEGSTLAVFQFESPGMQEYLKMLKPKNLEEITAMNALYRPGPMENIPEYIDRKFGRKEITYLHPIMKKSLENTYGIIVYQEQVMQLARDIAGFSLGQADILRRAMGKKKQAVMDELQPLFIEGAAKNGLSKDLAMEIYNLIQKFAKYGFNKSHSLAYSYLAYQTAWLKANFPGEFLAANMTAELNDQNKIVALMNEAEGLDIKVMPPDVNKTDSKFQAEGDKIYFSLAAIKNVGIPVVEKIVKVRQEKPYTSFFDFTSRVGSKVMNRRALEALVCAGAFDSINGQKRAEEFASIETALGYAKACENNKNIGMESLFGGGEISNPVEPEFTPTDPWSDKKRLENEKKYLNFYISGHPLDSFKAYMNVFDTYTFDGQKHHLVGQDVRVTGMITSVTHKFDKKNRPICFAQLENETGVAELIFWSRSYSNYASLVVADTVVCCDGKAEEEDGKHRIVVNEIISISDAANGYAKGIRIWVNRKKTTEEALEKLSLLCDEPNSSKQIEFVVFENGMSDKKVYIADNVNISFSERKINMIGKLFGRKNIKLY
jgi:DNA polymerase-3 subunit alpha